jgi:hypothetical protein
LVLVITVFGELDVVEVDVWVLGDNDSPPTPHQTAKELSNHQIRLQLFPLLNILELLSHLLELLLELLPREVRGHQIGINETDLHLLCVWPFWKNAKVRLAGLIIVNSCFLKVICDIKEREVIASVLIIDEDSLSVFLKEKHVVRKKIVMGKHQRFTTMLL